MNYASKSLESCYFWKILTQFKPWSEFPAPRHLLDDESNETPLIPEVTVDFDGEQISYALLVPAAVSILAKKAPGSLVGKIGITYHPTVPNTSEEYDEDEQLYAAMAHSHNQDKYKNQEIPIIGGVHDGESWISVTVPPSENPIAYNILARAIVERIPAKTWITVAPGSFYGHTVAKLESLKHASAIEVPELRPPHFVTGIAAAVNRHASDVLCLVVNAEGQTGYERVDADALADVSYVIGSAMKFGDEYSKTVAKAVRRSESNSIYV